MEEVVKIPADRVAVLLGEKGKTKELLEQKCNIKLTVGEEGEVHLIGETADIYFSKDVVLAIGRGFDPDTALRILNDQQLYIYHLKEYFHSENAITRIKGRIIGEGGKTKTEIEDAADCRISVYGNTVAIIAKADSMEYAKQAIEKLINGAMHLSVYKYLTVVRRKLFEERLRGQ
ncbi:MAG: KH domain-containing protein [Candidatus Micrarchaeota archaeon]